MQCVEYTMSCSTPLSFAVHYQDSVPWVLDLTFYSASKMSHNSWGVYLWDHTTCTTPSCIYMYIIMCMTKCKVIGKFPWYQHAVNYVIILTHRPILEIHLECHSVHSPSIITINNHKYMYVREDKSRLKILTTWSLTVTFMRNFGQSRSVYNTM